MIFCDIGRALALGSIPFAYALGHLTIAQLYITALIEGTLFTFFNLAETARLPQIVPKEHFPPPVPGMRLLTTSHSSSAHCSVAHSLVSEKFSLSSPMPFLTYVRSAR